MRGIGAVVVTAAVLAGCRPPPYLDKSYLPFAAHYYKSCEEDACPVPEETLTLEQLYAVHLYGGKYHHGRTRTGEFVRRGAGAVPFLRAKLAAARDNGEIAAVFGLFEAMREGKSYEVRSDPTLIAEIQHAANRVDDWGSYLRDKADELETGEGMPFSASVVGRKWLHGHADDYDVKFAKAHCRGCDFRDWKAGIETLPIDKLYALYRIGWEDYHPARNIEPLLAARGASAIPFVKTKLAEAKNGLMLMNLLSLLEMMRDTGSYDPARDPELLALVDAAVGRVEGTNDWNQSAAQRLRTGTPHPLKDLRNPPRH